MEKVAEEGKGKEFVIELSFFLPKVKFLCNIKSDVK